MQLVAQLVIAVAVAAVINCKSRWVVEAWLHSFQISALDGCEWLTPLMTIISVGKNTGTHLMGGGVGPRPSL
jgi:hypothetical protein